jgi:hypothetical protein
VKRALSLDVVKIFLTKQAARGVVINNITFNEDNYANVKTHLGTNLIDRIHAVVKTIWLLIKTNWKFPGQLDDKTVLWNEKKIEPTSTSLVS